jgi:hypothetical protein
MSGREGITVVSANLRLIFQKTLAAQARNLKSYIDKAIEVFDEYNININMIDRQLPHLDFGLYDSLFDKEAIRKASEKQFPGENNALRVIFAEFDNRNAEYAVTETIAGGRDFIVLNTRKINPDGGTLIHEMVHATGLVVHDTNPDSFFAVPQPLPRTILLPYYAQRISTAFFSDRLP